MKHKDLNQLLCAAVVNDRFRETLLRDPAQAIASGFMGHNFFLTSEERDLVIGIQAQQLEDLAAQVYHWISGNGHNGNGHKGNGNAYNGHGQGHNRLESGEPVVDFFRARLPA
jgi:hypothetical protein